MNAERCGLIASELRWLELKKYLWHKCGDMWSMKSFISRPLRGTAWHNDRVRPAAAGMCWKSQIGDIWRWQSEELCWTHALLATIVSFTFDTVYHEHHGGCSYRMLLIFILVFDWTAVVSYNTDQNPGGMFLALQKDSENDLCWAKKAGRGTAAVSAMGRWKKKTFVANIKRVPWCVNRQTQQARRRSGQLESRAQ